MRVNYSTQWLIVMGLLFAFITIITRYPRASEAEYDGPYNHLYLLLSFLDLLVTWCAFL